jgi:hypothetical protein
MRTSLLAIVSTFLCCSMGTAPVAADGPELKSPGFVKGFSWGWVGRRGEYASPAAADSMKKLAETGAEYVCIAFSTEQRTHESPDFTWGDGNRRMVSDDEIRHAIDLARDNGLRVILKPVVNCDDQVWRAWIRFYRPVTDEERAQGITGEFDPWGEEPRRRDGYVKDMAKWETWWQNFGGFLIHYAHIAAEKEVEAVCLGCEMNSTEEFEARWRDLIARVRDVYGGQITYDVNHGREREVAWWDAVDFISTSAYYPVPPPQGVAVEEAILKTTSKSDIVAELERVKDELTAVSAKWQKPILFIETGVTNVRGCARYPWSHPYAEIESPLDETEQANYYEAMFEVFWEEPWFMGFAWWDWPARLYSRDRASANRGFSVYGKQAEEVVRAWYAKPRRTPE